jgi:hypothetical protein
MALVPFLACAGNGAQPDLRSHRLDRATDISVLTLVIGDAFGGETAVDAGPVVEHAGERLLAILSLGAWLREGLEAPRVLDLAQRAPLGGRRPIVPTPPFDDSAQYEDGGQNRDHEHMCSGHHFTSSRQRDTPKSTAAPENEHQRAERQVTP